MEKLIKEESLGTILCRYEIISESDVQRALEEQKRSGCRFGEALIALGIVATEDIDWALSNQLDIPYVRLKADLIDLQVARSLPGSLARRFGLIPLVKTGDELRVAMVDPLDSAAVKAVEEASGCRVSVAIALKRDVAEMLDFIYGSSSEGLVAYRSSLFPEIVETINADATCEALVNSLLNRVLEDKFSLSFEHRQGDVVITAKHHSGNREEGRFSAAAFPLFLERLEERLGRLSGTGSFRDREPVTNNFGAPRRIRLCIIETSAGPFVTVSPAVPAPLPLRLEELELDRERAKMLQKLMANSDGIVLVADRSPKERAAFINILLKEKDLQGKQVFQVGNELLKGDALHPQVACLAGQAHEVLQAVLEHNPEVVALEDISDHHSLMQACNAAMRKRLLIGGLSCHGAAQALRHLNYSWRKGYILPLSLRGVVACTSVPLLCPQCKEELQLSAAEKQGIKIDVSCRTYGPRGCEACDMTGYIGRKYLVEVIQFDEEFRSSFEDLDDEADIASLAASIGHRDFMDEGRDLLAEGRISPMDYLEYIFH